MMLSACGDDDEEGAGDVQAYCEYSASLDELEDVPSDAQLDELKDLAPSEIAAEVETVADAIAEEGDSPALQDPDIQEALTEIDRYEAEHCGREPGS